MTVTISIAGRIPRKTQNRFYAQNGGLWISIGNQLSVVLKTAYGRIDQRRHHGTAVIMLAITLVLALNQSSPSPTPPRSGHMAGRRQSSGEKMLLIWRVNSECKQSSPEWCTSVAWVRHGDRVVVRCSRSEESNECVPALYHCAPQLFRCATLEQGLTFRRLQKPVGSTARAVPTSFDQD